MNYRLNRVFLEKKFYTASVIGSAVKIETKDRWGREGGMAIFSELEYPVEGLLTFESIP